MSTIVRGFIRRRVLTDLIRDHDCPRLRAKVLVNGLADKDIDGFLAERRLAAPKEKAAGPVLDWLYEHREEIAQVILLIVIQVLLTAAAAAPATATTGEKKWTASATPGRPPATRPKSVRTPRKPGSR